MFGGLQAASYTTSSAGNTTFVNEVIINNRGDLGSQFAAPAYPSVYGMGGTTIQTLSVDTTSNAILTLTAKLAVAAETITLESYVVEVLPG
jgi:hypothetical protein